MKIYNNSVVCNLITSSNVGDVVELQNYVRVNGLELTFTGKYMVMGTRVYIIPVRCLNSLKSLITWITYIS
jgi:hypothetical protein